MKKALLTLLILFGVMSNIFAHDKGDLMFNIEPQIGIALPDIGVKIGDIAYKNIPGVQTSAIGFDLAVRVTVHYYFFDFFGINTGLGLSGLFSSFNAGYTEERTSGSTNIRTSTTDYFTFTGLYISIPIGFRFSLRAFTIGAGFTANIPIVSGSETYTIVEETRTTSGGFSNTRRNTSNSLADNNFSLDTYIGWYADISLHFLK